MKIISQIDTSTWSHKCKCGNCESQLEVEASDIRHSHSKSDGIYPSSDSYYVCCPVCSYSVIILTNDMPKIVQIEAQKRCAPSPSLYNR